MIPCSEKCLYQDDGICTLKEITKASDTPIKECPYFVEKASAKSSKS